MDVLLNNVILKEIFKHIGKKWRAEVFCMNERLTWEQIQEKYPDQWVGLVEVEYEPDNDATIKSAVVKYTNKSKSELTRMQILTNGEILGRYTTPDNVFQLGAVGYFG